MARLMMGSTFAILGWEAATTPGPRVDMATRTLGIVRTVLPLPRDDELLVRINGGAQAAGGALLAVGLLSRLASALLAASPRFAIAE
jgi:putative oxidoreductase